VAIFKDESAHHLPVMGSDHGPILVNYSNIRGSCIGIFSLKPCGWGNLSTRTPSQKFRLSAEAMLPKFFISGAFKEDVNNTILILIPKKKTSTDFRPIPFCSVTYKAVARILANKI